MTRRRVRAALALGFLATFVAIGPAVAATHPASRSVSKPYQTACRLDRGLLLPCGAEAGVPGFGGFVSDVTTVTFAGRKSERRVTISVHDLTGLPVPFTVDGTDNGAQPFDLNPYCGQASFEIPAYAVIDVYLSQAYASLGPCPGLATVGVATSGSVTATFRS